MQRFYRSVILLLVLSLIYTPSVFAQSQVVNLPLASNITDTIGGVTSGTVSRVSDLITTKNGGATRYEGDGDVADPSASIMDETDAGDNIVCDDTAGSAYFGADNAGGSPEVSDHANTGYLVKACDATPDCAYGYAGATHGTHAQAVDIYDSPSLTTQDWLLIEDGFDDTAVVTYDIYVGILDQGTSTAEAAFVDQGFFNPHPVTNILLQSNSFSNAIWTGIAGHTQDETDIFGTANTAWTFEDDDAGSKEDVNQTLSKLTTDTDTYHAVLFIKKDTDETRFPELYVVFSGGTAKGHGLQINTSTGASDWRTNSDSAATGIVTGHGNWWLVEISVADGGSNDSIVVYVRPAAANTLGGNDNSSVGSIITNYAHIYKSDFSPGPIIIPTTTTPIAITSQVASFTMGSDLKDILSTAEGDAHAQGTLGVTWYPYFDYGDTSIDHGIVTVRNDFLSLLFQDNTGKFYSYDNTTFPLVDPDYVANTEYKVFVRWDEDIDASGDFTVSEIHGGSLTNGTTAAFDGAFTLGTDLIIGYSNDYPFAIKTVQIWDAWQPDSWLENVYGADSSDGITDMGMGMGM